MLQGLLRSANATLAQPQLRVQTRVQTLERELGSAVQAYQRQRTPENRKELNDTLAELRSERSRAGQSGDTALMQRADQLLDAPAKGKVRYRDIDPDGGGALDATYVGHKRGDGSTVQTRVRIKETYDGNRWVASYQAVGVTITDAQGKLVSERPGRVYELKGERGTPLASAEQAVERTRQLLQAGAISTRDTPPSRTQAGNPVLSPTNDGRFESNGLTIPAGIKGLGNPYVAELRGVLDTQVVPDAKRYLQSGNALIDLRGNDLQNYVGVAMNLAPNVVPVRGGGSQVLYQGEALQTINQVAEAIRDAGGDAPEVRAVPVYLRVADDKMAKTTIFRVRGDDGRERIVDQVGRTYESMAEWKKNNKLGAVDVYVPKDGQLQADGNGKVVFEAFNNRRLDNTALPVIQSGVALLGAGAGVAVMLGTGGAAAPIILAGASAFAATNGTLTLVDRNRHGQTLSLSNSEARSAWLDVAGGLLGVGAIGTGNRVLAATSDVVDLITLGDGVQQYVRDFNRMSVGERVVAGSQLLFWGAMLGADKVRGGNGRFDFDALTTRIDQVSDTDYRTVGGNGTPQSPEIQVPNTRPQNTNTVNPGRVGDVTIDVTPQPTPEQVAGERRQQVAAQQFNDPTYQASLRQKLKDVAGDDPGRIDALVANAQQLDQLTRPIALDQLEHRMFAGSGVPESVRTQFLGRAEAWAQQQAQTRGGTVAGHLEALALNGSATRADLLRPLVAAQMGGGNKPLEQAVQAQLKGMNEGELKNLLVKRDGQPQQAYVDLMTKALVARWSEDFGLNSARQSRLQQGIDARLQGKSREQQRVELVNLANSDVLRRSLVTAATEGRVTQPVETGKKTPNNDGVDSQTPPSDVALNPQSSDPSDPLSVTYSVGGQSITLRRVLSDYVAWKEGPGRSPSAYSGNPPWFVSVGQKAEAAVGFDNLKLALNTERPNTTAQFDILNALGVPPSLISATSSVDPNDDVPAVTTNKKPTSNTSNNASGLDAQGQRAQQLFIAALNKNPQLTNPDGFVDKASAADAAARFLSDYNDLQLQYNGAVELTTTIFAHKTQQGVRYFVAFPAVGSQFTVPSSVDNRVVLQLPPGAVVVAQLHNHPLNTSVAPIAGPSLDDVGTLIQRAGGNLRTLEGDYIVQTVTTPDGTTPILMQVELKPQLWLVEDKAKLGRLISSGQADPNDYVRVRYIPMAGQPTASPVPLNVVTYDDNKQLRTVLRPDSVIGAQADITAPMFPNATSKQTSQQSIDLQPLLGQNAQTPALDKATGLVGGVLSKDVVVVRRPVDTSFRRSEIFEKVPERSDYASDADFARDVGNWYRGLVNLLTQQLKNRGDIDLNISYSDGSTTSLRTLRDQLRAEYNRLKPTLDAAINSGTTSGTDWTAHNQANATRQVRALIPEALTQTGLNPQGKTAIDLGSGAGVETQKLLDLGFGKVIAVDGDQGSMSQLLGRIGSQSRLETQVTTFENAKFDPRSVDFVWSGLSLSHVHPAKFESAWNNVDTAIKPGGVFAGDFFASTSSTSHPDPNRSYFTEAQLRELFDKSGYNIVSLQRTSSLRFENGSDFRGQIPLWEVVAVKRGAESQPTVQTGNTNSSISDKPNLTDADPTDSSDKTTPQTNDASSSSWRSYYEATFGRPPEGTLVRFMNNRIRGGENLPDRSLVLGSGDGAETAYLISQGQDVVAVDLDPASAEFVQRSIELRRQDSRFNPENFGNVTTVQGSFQDFRLPSAGSVDLVWSASLPFVSRNELPAVLKRVEQTLSPDGHVVATFFGPNHPLASQSDKTIYSEAELRALFSKDYDVVSINRISPNGRLADGTQVKLDLFEVVARKRGAPNVDSSSTTYSNQIPPTDTSRTDSIAEPDTPSSVNNMKPVDKNTASENGDTPSADITSNTPAQIADTAEFLSQLEGTSTLDDIMALMDRAPATVLRDPQVTQSLLRKLNDTGEVVFRVDSRSPSEIVADGGFKLAPGHDFIYAATDLYSGGGHNHPNGGFYVIRKPPVTETFGPTVFDFEAEANRRYQEYQSTGNMANLSTNPYFNVSQLTPQQQQNLRLHAGNQFQIRYARDIPLNEIVLAGQLGADGHTLQYLAPVDRIQNGRPADPGKGVTNNTQGDSASTSYEELQSLFNRPIDAEKMQELSGRWANIDTQWQQLQQQIEEIRSDPSDTRNAALNRAESHINDFQMSGSGTLTPGLMSNATIADAQRARANWQAANRQIAIWAERGEPLTLDRIKDLNRQLGQGLTPFNDPGLARESNARFGELRGPGQDIEDGMVTGQDYLPGEDVDRAMRDFVAWYQTNEAVLPPQQLAAQAYQRLVSIHPFQDGNGRTALAVANWILMAKGSAPIAVDPNQGGGVLALFPSFGRNLPSGHSEELITSAQENALRIYRQALQIDAGKGVTKNAGDNPNRNRVLPPLLPENSQKLYGRIREWPGLTGPMPSEGAQDAYSEGLYVNTRRAAQRIIDAQNNGQPVPSLFDLWVQARSWRVQIAQ